MADESDAGIEMDEDEDDFFVSFVTSLFSFLCLFFFLRFPYRCFSVGSLHNSVALSLLLNPLRRLTLLSFRFQKRT